MLTTKKLSCDLCVVGGGIAGMCAAISAAREGASVVLMHERAVLGGNASSEIRMWICGSFGENNRETGILEEIALENMYRNPSKSYPIWDTVLFDFVKREKNITLLLNCTCMDAEVEKGSFADGRDTRIKSVKGYQMTTQTFFELEAKNFADCSGDSILAPLTGAAFRMGREGKDEFGENTKTEQGDSMTMGMSCLIGARETERPVRFTPPSFAKKLTEADFYGREPDPYNKGQNFWYLELGGDRDSIHDTEEVRDELVGLALGTWDYVKNSGAYEAKNWDMDFIGFLPGKRESRRMVGEYTVREQDLTGKTVFEDEVAYGGWPIDDHYPGGFYHRGMPNTSYNLEPPYSIPYRALYSSHVENLFFAGRNVSMTHVAMSSMRVMATCGLLGEAVGRAAALCAKYGVTPHGVYKDKSILSEMQARLMAGDCFLPSKRRDISPICRLATLSADAPVLRNGEDRGHKNYGTTETNACYEAEFGERITYTFERSALKNVHIVFDSDLNRKTQVGDWVERTRNTRILKRLDSSDLIMPATLCRAFKLIGRKGSEEIELLCITDNRKRAYDLSVDGEFDSLTLIPLALWGEGEKIPVISFDFA
ncbi:MAG: FAD-dependent oxidoreductase [Ruminococcaceae bacterium]|nr:FAD-dependent oxidoreductase [Oscillospiraceae bacterium]